MSDLRDDTHRLSIVVTPLQPPFEEDVMFFSFEDGNQLAVSKAEGQMLKSMLGGGAHVVGRTIILSKVDDSREQIRVTVTWDA